MTGKAMRLHERTEAEQALIEAFRSELAAVPPGQVAAWVERKAAEQRVLDACAALTIVAAKAGNATVVNDHSSIALVLQAELARRGLKP